MARGQALHATASPLSAVCLQELKDLKDSLDSMTAKMTAVAEAGGRAESRAQAAWDLIREHICAIADDAGVPVDALQTPAFEVRLR